MTTILAIFLIALLISIVLTPLSGKLGLVFGAVDAPGERKIHRLPLPRIGGLDGLAAGISFFASLVMVVLAVMKEDILTAMMFAASGGAVLGFPELIQIGAEGGLAMTSLFFLTEQSNIYS